MTVDPHAPLRADVRMLGEMLGEVLSRCEGDDLLETVERVRALSKRRRAGEADLAALGETLASLPDAHAVAVARAFSQFLALANVAEQHHRIRRARAYESAHDAAPQEGSFDAVFASLAAGGVRREAIAEAVYALRIELVLTAHPTEISRRTVRLRSERIAAALATLDDASLTPRERAWTLERLRAEVSGAWLTDEIRPEPTA